jgi:hypothetical protein
MAAVFYRQIAPNGANSRDIRIGSKFFAFLKILKPLKTLI